MIGRLCEKGSPSCSRDPWLSTNEWHACGGSPPPPISQPVSSPRLVGWLLGTLAVSLASDLGVSQCPHATGAYRGHLATHRGTAIGEIPRIGVPTPRMIPSRSLFEPTRQLGEASHLRHLSRRRRPLTARASDPWPRSGHLPVWGRIDIPPGAK